MSLGVAITGFGESDLGVVPNQSPMELTVAAIQQALVNTRTSRGAIDTLITCNSLVQPIMYHAEATAEYMGLTPRHCITVGTGGGTTYSALRQAAAYIREGMSQTVVFVMADSMRSFITRERAMVIQASAGHATFEQPYGPTVPAYYALIAQAHMARFGTTEAQFAEAMV